MNTKKEAPCEGAPVNSETQHKDTHFFQFQRTQIVFFEQPRTMMEAAKIVGCDRANTCRYVATMRKEGVIWLIRKGTCPVTRWDGVGFWSTNPKYAEKLPVQLSLF